MSSSEFYRAEAKRARALAATEADPAIKRRFEQRALECEQLAEVLEKPASRRQREPGQQAVLQRPRSRDRRAERNAGIRVQRSK